MIRPKVAFEFLTRWFLNQFQNGKKIARDNAFASLMKQFGARYQPQGLRTGALQME